MIEIIFLFALGLVYILFATVQDLKVREIANWLNFSLIFFAIAFRLFYSLFTGDNFNFFYQGLIGLGIFFALGNFLYYTKFFAGGDAKLMFALGPILAIFPIFSDNLAFFIRFLIIFLIVGGFYSLIFSLSLSFRNFENFKKQFKKLFKENQKRISILTILGILVMLSGFYDSLLFYLGIFVFILPYFYVYAKAVDEACMIKRVNTKKLLEGDWLYSDLKIGKKVIKANWDGLTKKQINLIKRKKRFVKIRTGIAFTPVFLISYLILFGLYFF